MKLVGIMPVRNEDWILGFSLRVALKWCDAVCLQLHSCVDRSEDIMLAVAGEDASRVCWHSVHEVGWNEMSNRQKLLDAARWIGATHIALIDADEVLTANLLPGIRGIVEATPSSIMLDLPLYNLRAMGNSFAVIDKGVQDGWKQKMAFPNYHANGIWGQRWIATAFEDRPELNWQGDQFHHREPFGCNWRRSRPIAQDGGGVMHFWGASERRLRAKHALYKITERIRFPRKRITEIDEYYNLAIIPRKYWTFKAIRPEWIEPYGDLMRYLDVDREPWQEVESKRLYQQYGAKLFDGLDLFGVV